MIHRFFRHIKEGFKGVIRHFGMAVSAMSAVTITLTLIGLFIVLTLNLNTLTRDIEKSISISALVNYDVISSNDILDMKNEIENIEGVSYVEYRTKEQEFDYYCDLYPEIRDFNELYRDQNPFHDAFMIHLGDNTLLEDVKHKVEMVSGIDSVHDGGSNTYILVDILQKVRIFGGVLVLALCILAVYLIYNTIKITIASRRDEIWIMRNVGAKNGYVRAPFLVEGIIIGLFGSLIPIGVIAGSYIYAFDVTGGNLLGVFKLIAPLPFLYYVAGIILFVGIAVGFLGSYISVCKYLRSRR